MDWLVKLKLLSLSNVGSRLITDDLDDIKKATDEVSVMCSCGHITRMSAYNAYLSLNNSKNCGKCWLVPILNGKRKFNELTILSDVIISTKVSEKVDAMCNCGVKINASVYQIINGKRKSCGNCKLNGIIKSGVKNYGSYSVIDDLQSVKKLTQKVNVKCDCGYTTKVFFINLVSGNSKSCGRCDLVRFRECGQKSFGSLTVTDEFDEIKSLTQNVNVACKCGGKTTKKLHNILSGHTKSCGRCYESVKKWWDTLHTSDSFTNYPIKFGPVHDKFNVSNIIESGRTTLEAKCPTCGCDWRPKYNDVLRGVALTCGCSYSRVSTAQIEIGDLISNYTPAKYEHKINDKCFDIFTPEFNLLIEYHGLRWHSLPHSKRNDIEKFRMAKNFGYEIMVIYEDEWRDRRRAIEVLIKNRIGAIKSISVRPNKCKISIVSNKSVRDFYDEYHYLGAIDASTNVVAQYNDEIVASMSFKAPGRQSEHKIELIRMASKPEYRVHGIWTKMLGEYIKAHSPKTIISFSDNRLFTGRVYSLIGFKNDGQVKPDYYWVNSKKRHHKSAMRRPKGEKLTETELRTSQGFAKLWDCGKTRWVWNG